MKLIFLFLAALFGILFIWGVFHIMTDQSTDQARDFLLMIIQMLLGTVCYLASLLHEKHETIMQLQNENYHLTRAKADKVAESKLGHTLEQT